MSYELILMAHIGAFLLNISLVIAADSVGLLWVLGKIKKLPKKFMLLAHRLIWFGLVMSISTGVFMFWDLREYLFTVPAFYTKMFFLLALVINSLLISRHLNTALSVESFKDSPAEERRAFLISGAVSTVSWICVVVSAKFLGL